MHTELSLELSSPNTLPLEARMAEFKEDPEKMDQMLLFVNDVITKAQAQAGLKLDAKKVSTPNTFYLLLSSVLN